MERHAIGVQNPEPMAVESQKPPAILRPSDSIYLVL